jgi:hypothetical protein
MREASPSLPPGAYLLGAGPGAEGLTFAQMGDLLGRLVARVTEMQKTQ